MKTLFILIFVHLISSAKGATEAPPTDSPVDVCPYTDDAHQCLGQTFGDLNYFSNYTIFVEDPVSTQATLCNAKTACLEPLFTNCSEKAQEDFLLFKGLLDYLCSTTGYKDFLDFNPCFQNKEFIDTFYTCGFNSDVCLFASTQKNCSIELATRLCPGSNVQKLSDALDKIFKPATANKCQSNTPEETTLGPLPLETTTTPMSSDPPTDTTLSPSPVETTTALSPAPPRDYNTCYRCSSGRDDECENDMCPANGNIWAWSKFHYVKCSGPCMSTVTRGSNAVVRGCSDGKFPGLHIPANGCLTHKKEVTCFCTGDRCNTRNMVQEQAKMRSRRN
ncbi:uncharacterized protein LOC131938685 [Physella acuta]|uniref:uncharacterized protein LOC131938685 n=1 Tax=Physella acuta TaxID=109671 RepID=UPI0027DB745C|nr:uncharacterized protein LOC131938685 [Physella acuta]